MEGGSSLALNQEQVEMRIQSIKAPAHKQQPPWKTPEMLGKSQRKEIPVR